MKLQIPYDGGVVREMRDTDIPKLTEMSNEKEILKYYFKDVSIVHSLIWEERLEENEWGDRIEEMGQTRNGINLSIENGGNLTGFVGLRIYPYEILTSSGKRRHSIKLHYLIGEEHRNQKIGTRAIGETVNYANENLNPGEIIAITSPGNIASQKLLERLGFKGDMKPIYVGGRINGACAKRFRIDRRDK
jgi:RimJ/RimL family protein N-acetyltransferase